MASWYQSGLENVGEPFWKVPDSKHKRRELNSTLVCFQKEQNLVQAMQLQSQWKEIREREHRAWVRNRQLLQDFQKAQETLKDLSARTAAMGTIRVEFEKQLDQKFSRWQQRLNEKRLQRKEAELHVKDFLQRQEENRRGTDSGLAEPAHSQSLAGPSYFTNTPLTLHTDRLKKSRDLKNTSAAFHKEDYSNSTPNLVWNSMFHPSWLTQVEPQTSASQAQTLHNLKANVSMEDSSFQEHCRAGYPFQVPLPSPAIQPFDPCWLLPPIEPLSSWYGLYTGLPARPQFTSLQVPWPGFPSLDPRAWGTSKGQEHKAKEDIHTSSRRWEWEGRDDEAHPLEGSRCLRKERSNDQSSELDVRPVRLSSTPRVDSGRSSACSGAPSESCSRVPRKKKYKRGRISECHTVRTEISCKRSSGGCKCAERTISRVGALCVHHMEQSLETKRHQRRSSSPECLYKMATVPPDQEREEVNLSQEEAVEGSAGLDMQAGNQESTADEEEMQHSSLEEEDEEDAEDVKEVECKGLVKEERQEREKEGRWDGNKGETGDETEIARREENEDNEMEVTEEEVGTGEGEESSASGESDDGESDGIPEPGECVEQEETSDEEAGEKLPNSEQDGAQEKGDGVKVELQGGEDDEAQGSGHFEECNEEEGDTEGERKSMISLSESSDDEGEDGEESRDTMKESAKEQEEMEDDISKEEEEADEEEMSQEEAEDGEKKAREGSKKAEETAASNSSDKENEGESDSDDEIICSQLKCRKLEATNEGWKTKAKENMTKIQEEEEGEEDGEEYRMNNKNLKYDRAAFRNVMTNDGEGEWADAEEDIEGLLAPRRSSPKPHVPAIADEKATGRARALKEEPGSNSVCSAPREKKKFSMKPKALWHDSESDSVEEMLAGGKPAAPSMDDQDNFDGFYD